MRQDEFVERHGLDAWNRLVKPMQERGRLANDGVIHKTKAEGDADTEHFDGKTTE